MNLKRIEAKVLDGILENAEFWCDDCGDPGKTCAECPTYLEWEMAKKAMLEKLHSSCELYGRQKKSLERQGLDAWVEKYRAQRHYERITKKVETAKGAVT
jgi:hypothetical protein